jgi:hypothetical protein
LHLGSTITKRCSAPHSASVLILLQSFHSRNGQAYLFNTAVNVTVGRAEERMMTTGAHVVQDLHCVACSSLLGWRYVEARAAAQKYKEGKFILERAQLVHLEAAAAAAAAVVAPLEHGFRLVAAAGSGSPGSIHPPPLSPPSPLFAMPPLVPSSSDEQPYAV